MRKKWIFYFVGGLSVSPCCAQSLAPSILNSAGGSAVVGSHTHEWSVGEMVLVETATAGPTTITQGVLQPVYSSGANIDEHTSGMQENLLLYPNPTDGAVFLKPELPAGTALNMTLLDLTGKVLSRREVQLYQGNEQQNLDLTPYAAGMYILSVQWQQGNKPHSTGYKIEKRQ